MPVHSMRTRAFRQRFLEVFLCLNMWEKMALQGNPCVNEYSSEVKSIKYENLILDRGWVVPHSPRIPEKKERANQPPDGDSLI
ncbi:hypothetical protein Tco_1445729 [Tanacetum coccineum]